MSSHLNRRDSQQVTFVTLICFFLGLPPAASVKLMSRDSASDEIAENGNTHTQAGAAQHAIASGDSRNRDQPRPQTSFLRKVYGSGGESTGLRSSRLASLAARNSYTAERSAGRRQRFGSRGDLPAAGQRPEVLSYWSGALQPGKCLGNHQSARGLELRFEPNRGRRRRRGQSRKQTHRQSRKQERQRLALQFVLRPRRSPPRQKIAGRN